jgi:hypothetical protein
VRLKGRLAKLEKLTGVADGRCLACGLGPAEAGRPHRVVIARHPDCDWTGYTDGPPGPGWKPAPEPSACPLCGGLVGPIDFAHEAGDGSLWVRDQGEEGP